MKKSFLLALIVGSFSNLFSQAPDYPSLALDSTLSFDSIVKVTQHYFDTSGLDTVPQSGYKAFKRWEAFWKSRVGDSINCGSFIPAIAAIVELSKTSTICNGGSFNEQWSFIGHNQTEPVESYNSSRGQGVLNKVKVDLSNDPTGNTIYVGSRTGGLWRTTNGKSSTPTWSCLTSTRLPGLGVNDILINPLNPNVIYISTSLGTGDEASYGMGILKTHNGQSSNPKWVGLDDVTYDLNNPNNLINTQGIYISPSDTSIIFVFERNTLYKSTDAGLSFNSKLTLTGSNVLFKDLVFLPSNSSVIYVSTIDKVVQNGGAKVFKSIDNGETWTEITGNLGFDYLKQQIDLAVTDANTSLVIAAGGRYYQDNYGIDHHDYEISKNYNSSSTWSEIDVTFSLPEGNIGWPLNDLAISQIDEDVIYIGASMLNKSTNGGSNFTPLYGYASNIVHPDVRDIEIFEDGIGNDLLYSANDGGLNYSGNGGSTWSNLNGTGLQITQIYGFDMNLSRDWITIGCQDLGLYSFYNGSWKVNSVGDGYKVLFDHFNSSDKMLGQNNNYVLNSTNGGIAWNLNDGSYGSAGRKMAIDIYGNVYLGSNNQLLRKPANSNTFSLLKTFTGAQWQITGIGISKSNPNVVYVGFNERTNSSSFATNKLFKTTNALTSGTVTWKDISHNLAVNWSGISDIVVDPNNSDHFWVATGTGFSNGGSTTADRIHFSTSDDPDEPTFSSINRGLKINSTSPVRFPVNVMVIDEATGGMYIGTDIGVYYNSNPKDEESEWVCFNKDLPTAIVTDLKIDYCNRKILASTFGRGLWESKLAEDPNKFSTLNTTNYLEQALTIEEDEFRIYNTDIVVPSGQTVVVKGVLKMATNRKIIINPGGKILIDGGKITSTCDQPWAGIYVEGNSNRNQSNLAYQGFLEIINEGTIENANDAVNLIGLNNSGKLDWSKTGGIIQATNSIFINNRRDVQFLSYTPRNSNGKVIPNKSFFRNCEFLTTDNNKITNSRLSSHITFYDVNGVQIKGCDFEDSRTNISLSSARVGIFSMGSDFTVTNYCTGIYSPPCYSDPSNFINLKHAVYANGSSNTGNILIENSVFSCFQGIYLQGDFGSVVKNNDFNILHFSISSDNNNPFGLYLDRSDQFYIEGNDFLGTTSTTTVKSGAAAGLVIRNTGRTNNEFYRNEFDNLKVASQALSSNRGLGKGLRFFCNDYEDNFNDFDIRNDVLSPYNQFGEFGIAENQGSKFGSVFLPSNYFGNASSILNWNIENLGNNFIYPYSGANNSGNRIYPLNTIQVDVKPSTMSNSCPDLTYSWAIELIPVVASLDDFKPQLLTAKSQRDSLVDDGNTINLKNSINNMTTLNALVVYNQLINASPFLSEEILVKVAGIETLFDSTKIKNILVANPHSARSLWVNNTLDNRTNLLSSNCRTLISNNVATYTYFDTLNSKYSAYLYSYDHALSEYISHYFKDSIFDINAYKTVLLHPINSFYHYKLAEMYFADSNWERFNQIVDSIPIKLELDSTQYLYHDAFKDFYTKVNEWEHSDTSVFQSDSARLSWLLNFHSTHSYYPSLLYTLLAVNDTIIEPARVYIPDTSIIENIPNTLSFNNEKNNEKTKPDILIYPNPINEILTLEWVNNDTPTEITIYDITGKTIYNTRWKGSSKLQIDTKKWVEGNYILIIKTANETVIKQEIILKR